MQNNNVPPLTVFQFVFNNEELEQEFYKFFYRNNLLALFTDEHEATPIRVSYNEARSVVREDGAAVRPLMELASLLTQSSDNNMYQEAMFRTIEEPRSFQGFMNYIKKLIDYIKTSVEDKHWFNLWNIVWYNKDLT